MDAREIRLLSARSARFSRYFGVVCAIGACSAGAAAGTGAIDLTFLNVSGEIQTEVFGEAGSPFFGEDFKFWSMGAKPGKVSSAHAFSSASIEATVMTDIMFNSGPITSLFVATFDLSVDGKIQDYDPAQADREASVFGFASLSSIFAEFQLSTPHMLYVSIDDGSGEPKFPGEPPFMIGAGTFAFSEVLPYSVEVSLSGPNVSMQEQRTVTVMLEFVIPSPGVGAVALIGLVGAGSSRRRRV